MIRKEELTYHVSVDPIEYKLNSLLGYELILRITVKWGRQN